MSTWLTYLLTLSIASVFNTVFQTLSSFFDKNLYCPRFVWIWFCFQPYIRRRQLWAEKWRFYLLLVSPCPPPATVPPVSTTSPHRQTCFLSWATLPYHCHTPSRPLKQYSLLRFRTEREHQNILLGFQSLDIDSHLENIGCVAQKFHDRSFFNINTKSNPVKQKECKIP